MFNGRAFLVAPEVNVVEAVAVRHKTAAAMLDCSESTIRNLLKAKRLESVLVGNDSRITTASIKKLAAA